MKTRFEKETIQELIQALLDQAESHNRPVWMITLHPGYRHAASSEWRTPSEALGRVVLEGFVGLMNTFLNNKRSDSAYVDGIGIIEKNEMAEPHVHIVVEQTTS